MVESGVDIGVQLHFIFGACQESMDQRAELLLVYNLFFLALIHVEDGNHVVVAENWAVDSITSMLM